MHVAVILRPSFRFLSCRVCVAISMFMEDACLLLMEEEKIVAKAFTGIIFTQKPFMLGR